MFHAKALEMYTQCYQSMAMMNEDEDLDVRSYLLFANINANCHYSCNNHF